MAEGIETRHSRDCPKGSDRGARCKCKPSHRGTVWDRRARKLVRGPWRSSQSEAKTWRVDAMQRAALGLLGGGDAPTIREAGEALVFGIESGAILNRSGDAYKPSVARGYSDALRLHVYPILGPRKLTAVTRQDVQAFADELRASGMNPSTIRNALMPLRVLYRRAVRDGIAQANPVEGVELPAVRGRRDRIASPSEFAALLERLDRSYDRALWGTAGYAGLRLGELRALRWSDVDLKARVIRVARSSDTATGVDIEPKTRAGKRTVPIIAALRVLLEAHKSSPELRVPEHADGAYIRLEGLVFPGPGLAPFSVGGKAPFRARAAAAWAEQKNPAGVVVKAAMAPIGLHECRHTYASLLIASGANAKTISTLMGHASITITFDRYGHLMPGGEDEAGVLLDEYLERAKGWDPVEA